MSLCPMSALQAGEKALAVCRKLTLITMLVGSLGGNR